MYGLKFALTGSVAFLVCITPAKAEQWRVVIQKDTDGTSYLADSDFGTDDLSQIRTFWTRAVYDIPRYGMKSLKVQYSVHCTNRTIIKLSYFEYDVDDNVVFSGNNNNENPPKLVELGSVEERLLTFACSNVSVRKQSYIEINKSLDNRELGVSRADPREVVSAPAQAPATKKSAGATNSLHMIATVRRYKDCVMNSIPTFAKSNEKFSLVALAAVSNCAISRLQVVASYKTSFGRSPDESRQFILSIDEQMQLLAEREVIKLRSK